MPDERKLIPNQKKFIEQYDAYMARKLVKFLTDKFGKTFVKNEIARYKEMGAFRKFVMDNYEIVEQKGYVTTKRGLQHRLFGTHRVFKLKSGYPLQEPK
jgi:hypothetical protein